MALKASALSVGDTHSEVVVDDLTRTQLVMYAGTSGDYNPLHTDDVYTREVAGKMLTNYVGDGRLKKFGVRFTNQVWPGDTLTSNAKVVEIRDEDGDTVVDLALETVNQDGKTVITGSATARVDP
jgi:acyl dehydratase